MGTLSATASRRECRSRATSKRSETTIKQYGPPTLGDATRQTFVEQVLEPTHIYLHCLLRSTRGARHNDSDPFITLDDLASIASQAAMIYTQ